MTSYHPETGTDKGVILVVEDDPALRELIEMVLASRGYQSISTWDGAAALKLIEESEHNFWLVLTDLRLPGIDGLELVRAIRSKDAGMAVVVASGRMEDETAEELMGLGVLAVLQKPFKITQLTKILAKVSVRGGATLLAG